MSSIRRPPIYRIPLVQTLVLLLMTSVAWWFNPTVAYSLALGGLIHLLPNLYFAIHAFRFQGARAMPSALRSLNRGEIGKFILTLTGFAVVFSVVRPLNVLALFLAYIAMIGVSLLVTSRILLPGKSGQP